MSDNGSAKSPACEAGSPRKIRKIQNVAKSIRYDIINMHFYKASAFLQYLQEDCI